MCTIKQKDITISKGCVLVPFSFGEGRDKAKKKPPVETGGVNQNQLLMRKLLFIKN
jgi:hypothetical protein